MKIDKNLKILIGIGAVLLIGIAGFGILVQSDMEKINSSFLEGKIISPIQAPAFKKATLILDDGEKPPSKFHLKIGKGTTVLDLLNQSGIRFDYEESDLGVFVESIGGVQNSKSQDKFWMYYVNGELAPVGVGQQLVNPSDVVEFRFESPSF